MIPINDENDGICYNLYRSCFWLHKLCQYQNCGRGAAASHAAEVSRHYARVSILLRPTCRAAAVGKAAWVHGAPQLQ